MHPNKFFGRLLCQRCPRPLTSRYLSSIREEVICYECWTKETELLEILPDRGEHLFKAEVPLEKIVEVIKRYAVTKTEDDERVRIFKEQGEWKLVIPDVETKVLAKIKQLINFETKPKETEYVRPRI